MGTWGIGVFENDTASDWLLELQSEGEPCLEKAIHSALAVGNDYLIADYAVVALAACEVIAHVLVPSSIDETPSENISTWIKNNKPEVSTELRNSAIQAVDRILTEPSELLELWADSDHYDDWSKEVANIRARILE